MSNSSEKYKSVIYLSGPYHNGGGTVDENIAQARKAAIEYWERGFAVICPHLNTAHFENDCRCVWEDFIAGDFEIIRRLRVEQDKMVMLPGWSTSKGAMAEHEEARRIGLKVEYY